MEELPVKEKKIGSYLFNKGKLHLLTRCIGLEFFCLNSQKESSVGFIIALYSLSGMREKSERQQNIQYPCKMVACIYIQTISIYC